MFPPHPVDLTVDLLPCPACGRDAYYIHQIDRYIHVDGLGNGDQWNDGCWLQCVRGNTDAGIHRANDAYLARRPRRRKSAA